MTLSPEQQAAFNRCQVAWETPPDLPAPLFDSLESCRIERCGINADCEDCEQKHCRCENWQDEKDEYEKEDYDD